MLNNCRALDLTDENGFLCGKILAGLGADVIKVEKPGGDSSRTHSAFWHDTHDPEKSLNWFAYNSNKRGITLNIEKSEGREILLKLIENTDFIIESFPPGYMNKLNLAYSDLSNIKKGLIMTSITPFGQKGPYSNYKGSDLTVMGMSGTLYQTGDSDGPPVRISIPQSCLHAGADAAVGAMVAYYHRERTGEGQHVDVSMQQSVAWFQGNAIPFYELNNKILGRTGAFRAGTSKDSAGQRQVWQCADGYVFFNVIGGKQGAKTLSSLVKWMDEEGMATDFLLNMEWDNFDMFQVEKEEMDQIAGPINKFFLAHTAKELFQDAVTRNVSIGPLFGMNDLLNDECLNARDFWVDIKHPELDTEITYPRRFVHSSEKDCSIKFRAPLVGEHNDEVYGEIGLNSKELDRLKQAGVI